MNRVRQAIIMGAGKGERMQPLTADIPKPLIEVNGISMIESVIQSLLENEIREIYIVVGYLKEKYESIASKYSSVKLIYNPYFEECNNISSLYVAREHLEDAMILDGDQIVTDPKALAPEFEKSGYNAVWTDEPTSEWLLETDRDGLIKKCSRTGGSHGWQLYSISRWSREDAKNLRRHLETEFIENRHYDLYWDDVALFKYPQYYSLQVKPMNKGDVVEIDTLNELAAIDPYYKKYLR